MIYHIYWGTAGNAGLYLDEIYQALKKVGYQQKAFVSYYYPFDYGEKIFFKRTEMEHSQYKGGLRKMLQAVELIAALIKIYISVKKDNPEIINYSYVSSGNVIILHFLKKMKKACNCKLVITCHDVVPFAKNKKVYESELLIKKQIYAQADYYLIHNENSRNDLHKLFKIEDNRVLMHPFPLMDLSKLDATSNNEPTQFDFLFIGQMRREKGIDILVEAWKLFHSKYPSLKLCIAGNPNYYKDYFIEKDALCRNINIVLKLGFVKDEDYAHIVKSARCVVFPYIAGTNSGVISTVISLRRDIITSNIDMFSNNPLVPVKNMFVAGDINSLLKKMEEYENGVLDFENEEKIEKYREEFNEKVKNVYSNMLVK